MLRTVLSAALMSSALVSTSLPALADGHLKTAYFAGGCFWCIEKDFDHVRGVVDTVSGYMGGSTSQGVNYKTYEAGGHREVLKITYDSKKVSYDQLLNVFWRTIDPTDGGGQFCDRGHGYSSAVYAVDDEQAKLAQASKAKLDAAKLLPRPVQTPIESAATFHAAEDYHQNYYQKNPIRYKYYRFSCGRDRQVKSVWGDQAYKGVMKKAAK